MLPVCMAEQTSRMTGYPIHCLFGVFVQISDFLDTRSVSRESMTTRPTQSRAATVQRCGTKACVMENRAQNNALRLRAPFKLLRVSPAFLFDWRLCHAFVLLDKLSRAAIVARGSYRGARGDSWRGLSRWAVRLDMHKMIC